MKRLIAVFVMAMSPNGHAASEGFDRFGTGSAPPGWMTGVTGKGKPRWTVEADSSAPSKPNVLKQSGAGDFPWAVRQDARIGDGYVEVKLKALSGKRDQAGGVVWRFRDRNNYYVARANAREKNVSLYYTEKGVRNTLKYVNAPVALNAWHVLRVEFHGKRIRVLLDGKPYIEIEDEHLTDDGLIGVWTKADSVTLFDDFRYDKSPDTEK